MTVSKPTKPLTHAERGLRGAVSRWETHGDKHRRIVRLDALTPEQRAIVLAFVEQRRAKADPK